MNEYWEDSKEISSDDMIGMIREATERAGGEAPAFVLINQRDFFILRGVFGNSPWRLRIDMRRLGMAWRDRKDVMADWRFAHPALARMVPKWM